MHYRVYQLNARGRIMSGDWIEAASEGEARAKAHEFCQPGVPTVELWDGAHRLAVIAGERPRP